MEDLVKNVQKSWLQKKAYAQEKCEREGDFETARKHAACSVFKGNEGIEGLIRLVFSPQGGEFMTTYKFPDLAILRKFKEYKPEIYGVYIDYGEFTISEPKNALIIGNTIATINCAELAKNRIILMHGARAIINASGYSIIRVEKDDASEVTFTKQDHARILL